MRCPWCNGETEPLIPMGGHEGMGCPVCMSISLNGGTEWTLPEREPRKWTAIAFEPAILTTEGHRKTVSVTAQGHPQDILLPFRVYSKVNGFEPLVPYIRLKFFYLGSRVLFANRRLDGMDVTSQTWGITAAACPGMALTAEYELKPNPYKARHVGISTAALCVGAFR